MSVSFNTICCVLVESVLLCRHNFVCLLICINVISVSLHNRDDMSSISEFSIKLQLFMCGWLHIIYLERLKSFET